MRHRYTGNSCRVTGFDISLSIEKIINPIKNYYIMRKIFVFSLCALLTTSAYTQLGGLKGKLKEKASGYTKKDNAGKSTNSSSSSASSPQQSSSSTSENKTVSKGKDYYIAPTGSGKEATKEHPSKDLAVILMQLQDGDVVHIAGGTYTSKLGRGSDVINKSVSILGGYSPDFSTRDPWGKYKTVFTGTNDYDKGLTTARLRINGNANAPVVIDGIIIDNGPRNRYKTDKHYLILRKANPSKGENPTPETPGIKVLMSGEGTSVTIQNCVVINTAPTQGAIDVQIGKNSRALIKNNLIVNNTGEGIMAKTNWQGSTPENYATYIIENNTILFNWKHDAIASYGGNSLMMDTRVNLTAKNNIFGFGDFGGVNNIKKCQQLVLINNNFFGHKKYDFFDTAPMSVADMGDYAEYVKKAQGNVSEPVTLPLNKDWAALYASRKEISRAEVDAASSVSNSAENQVRSILGLNLQGSSVSLDADIWLPQISVDDALALGMKQYNGRGCKNPF